MSERDKTTEKKVEPEILNPRYAGATPGMVARALLKTVEAEKEDGEGEEASPVIAERTAQSSI